MSLQPGGVDPHGDAAARRRRLDESDLRRGNKTANAMLRQRRSRAHGRLHVFTRFPDHGRVNSMHVMRVLADATNVIAEGEGAAAPQLPQRRRGHRRLPARDSLQDGQAVRGSLAPWRHPGWCGFDSARDAPCCVSACISARRSSSSTTCSTTLPRRPTRASIWVTISPKASPNLPLIHVTSTARPSRPPWCAAPSRMAVVTISPRCWPRSRPRGRSTKRVVTPRRK